MRSDKNGDVNKQAERCMFTAKQKKQKQKQNKQTNTKHHSNHGSTICWVEVFYIMNKFPQSLGTLFNQGSTVLRTVPFP